MMEEAKIVSAATGVSESEIMRLATAVADALSMDYGSDEDVINAISSDSSVAVAGYMMVSERERRMAMSCLTRPDEMARLAHVVYDRI